MEAAEWLKFMGKICSEAAREAGVITVAKTLPEGYQVQYEIRNSPEFDFWQECSHVHGILFHPGKASGPGCRLSSPNLETFEDVMAGKIDARSAAAFGFFTFGPLSMLTKVSAIQSFITKIYKGLSEE